MPSNSKIPPIHSKTTTPTDIQSSEQTEEDQVSSTRSIQLLDRYTADINEKGVAFKDNHNLAIHERSVKKYYLLSEIKVFLTSLKKSDKALCEIHTLLHIDEITPKEAFNYIKTVLKHFKDSSRGIEKKFIQEIDYLSSERLTKENVSRALTYIIDNINLIKNTLKNEEKIKIKSKRIKINDFFENIWLKFYNKLKLAVNNTKVNLKHNYNPQENNIQLYKNIPIDQVKYLIDEAINTGNINQAASILESRAEDIKKIAGYTPLITAVTARKKNYIEIAQTLINTKAVDINARNQEGETALIVAVYQNDEDMVKLLVENNANANITNSNNISVMDYVDLQDNENIRDQIRYALSVKQVESYNFQQLKKQKTEIITLVNQYITAGNTKELNTLIDQYGFENLNKLMINYKHFSLLDLIAQTAGDHVAVAEFLLQKEAEFFFSNNHEQINALRVALTSNNNKIANILIKQESIENVINDQDESGNTALHLAISKKNTEATRLLLKKNATIHIKNNSNEKSIELAELTQDQKIINLITNHIFRQYIITDQRDSLTAMLVNREINLKDLEAQDALTIIEAAIDNSSVETLKLLKNHGLNLATIDEFKNHALIYATRLNQSKPEMLDFLISEENSNDLINIPNHLGINAVMYAAATGKLNIVKKLVEKGANLNAQDHNGFTALHAAVYNNNKEVVQYLLADKSYINLINTRNNNGNTPLNIAISNSNTNLVELLLKKNPDVFLENNNKENAVDFAVMFKNKEIINIIEVYVSQLNDNTETKQQARVKLLKLLNQNFQEDINVFKKHIQNKNVKALQEIIEKRKINLQELDNNQAYNIMYFAINSSTEILNLLLDNQLSIIAENKEGNHALIDAVLCNRVDMLSALLLHGKSRLLVNKKNNHGITALHQAIAQSNTKIVQILLENGADINITNDQGNAAFELAKKYKNPEIITLIPNKNVSIKADTRALEKRYMPDAYIIRSYLAENNIIELEKLFQLHGFKDLNKFFYQSTARSLLENAAINSNVEIVKIILKYGSDFFSYKDQSQVKIDAAISAITSGNLENTKILIEQEDFENYINQLGSNRYKNTVLMTAVMFQRTEIVNIILKKYPDLTITNNDNMNALMIAEKLNNYEIINLLQEAEKQAQLADYKLQLAGLDFIYEPQLNFNFKKKKLLSSDQINSLKQYTQTNNLKKLTELLNLVMLNLENLDNQDAVIIIKNVINNNSLDMLKLLINKGINLSATNDLQQNALMLAVIAEQPKIVKFLLKQKNSYFINLVDLDGCSALTYAVKNGAIDIIKNLYIEGIDINLADKTGCTPLWYAVEENNLKVVKMLINYNANARIKNIDMIDALEQAEKKGNKKIILELAGRFN